MAHADCEGSTPIPAYAYLGPLLLVLILTTALGGSMSMLFSLAMATLRDDGWSISQLGLLSFVFNTMVWVLSTVVALLATYWSVKHHMPWFAFLMNPSGRASRAQYWLKYWIPVFLLLLIVLGIVAVGAAALAVIAGEYWQDAVTGYLGASYAFLVRVDLLLLWPWFAVMAKRLHDRGKSAWFLLLLLIPIVGPIWLFIEIALLRGRQGDNRYGPDPLAA